MRLMPILTPIMGGAIVAVIFTGLVYPGTTSPPERVCMSNIELRAYLAEVAMSGFGRGAGVCFSQYASFRAKAPKTLSRLEKTLKPYDTQISKLAIQPFRRSFGAKAESIYQRYLEADTKASQDAAQKYSEAQCTTYLAGLEVFTFVGSKAIENMVEMVFTTERQRVPTCNN